MSDEHRAKISAARKGVRRIDPNRREKKCSDCKVVLPIESFGRNRRLGDGHNNLCRECTRVRAKERYHRRGGRLYRHGLTTEQYAEMLDAQGGLCGICADREPAHIDHCHESNEVRGLLCQQCNTALGALGDNVEGLQRAIDYLNRC